jgi:hypothetical protein
MEPYDVDADEAAAQLLGASGGGPGSRGGQTVRKPRVTKADRAQMEQEKHEREKMAHNMNIAAKTPSAGPAHVGVT